MSVVGGKKKIEGSQPSVNAFICNILQIYFYNSSRGICSDQTDPLCRAGVTV